MRMYIDETEALRKAVATIKKIMDSEDFCTVEGINGVLLLLEELYVDKDGES